MPEPNSGCQLWIANVNRKGYGDLTFKGRKRLAHVASWEAHRGPTTGLCVLHRCDVPSCINPAHLFLGTRLDNNTDMRSKGRNQRGERHNWAKLTEKDVRAIRASTLSGVDAARAYGVSTACVSLIRAGKVWKHITR